jgi:hypothetical protein
MANSMKTASAETIREFARLVPSAKIKGSVASFDVKTAKKEIRVKRAESMANQIHVWRGEPMAIHVPSKGFYIIPVAWQLAYANRNALTAKQHASHAFECMMISNSEFSDSHLVAEVDLESRCIKALEDASTKHLRFVIEAISNTRTAVAQSLVQTYEKFFSDD